MEKQALAGRYALGERVGVGGMADVFTARDLRLERDVAIKLFRPGTADGLERGSAEARMLANLDHPGLVRVLDMDNGEHSGDRAYLVMELVHGPDLGVVLRTGGPLGHGGVRLMAFDLARTLQYIHGRGIVHRDLKPSNILTRQVDPDSGLFRYLLTDFGIARFFDGGRMTATGQVIGSAAYFSPEQARGDGVGQPSDVYSLGLVMIEALTGERAFPGTGIESALARLHRSPSIPHAAGPALSALLVSMTLDEPADRPDAARVVQALMTMGTGQTGDGATTRAVPAAAPPAAAPPTAAMVLPAATATDAATDTDAASGSSVGTRHDDPEMSTLMRVITPSRTPGGLAGGSVDTDSVAAAASTGGADGARVTRLAPEIGPRIVTGDDGQDVRAPVPLDEPSRPVRPAAANRPARRSRRVIPWIVAVLVIGLLAAALLVFTLVSGGESTPEIEPLPSVPGEPGEKLQELYESVQ